MVYENIVKLPHGFWIGVNGPSFDLGFNENILKDNCVNFSYVSDILIIVKKKNVVSIFSAVSKFENGKSIPKKLGEFSCNSPKLSVEVIHDGYAYLVDYNCHVTSRKI